MSTENDIYFISEHSEQILFHGGVGLVDIENILVQNNAIPIKFPCHFDFSFKAKMIRLWYLANIFLSIKPGSVIVFQHPVYARMNKLLLKLLRLRKKISVICLIADIDGLKDGNDKLLKKEIAFFKLYNNFILHNSNMEAWLRSFHPGFASTFLHRFDFLAKNIIHERVKTNTVVFAGNLAKSSFLELLHIWLQKNPSLLIHLYGPSVTDAMLIARNVTYKGVHPPHSLPHLIEGSFGLIWDGEGLEQPSGSLGDYMHYISHHKLSLYIVCNLPIIVHEEAGSAPFVKKFKIGFTVKSLIEIEEKINTLPEKIYGEMVANTRALANEITSGAGLKTALHELVSEINRKRNK